MSLRPSARRPSRLCVRPRGGLGTVCLPLSITAPFARAERVSAPFGPMRFPPIFAVFSLFFSFLTAILQPFHCFLRIFTFLNLRSFRRRLRVVRALKAAEFVLFVFTAFPHAKLYPTERTCSDSTRTSTTMRASAYPSESIACEGRVRFRVKLYSCAEPPAG